MNKTVDFNAIGPGLWADYNRLKAENEGLRVAQEPMKVALTVLCGARSAKDWDAAMLKDIDIAIEGLRGALGQSAQTKEP